jgi:hypothetical protein
MEVNYLMTVQEHQTAVQSLSTTVESQARELSEHRRVKKLDDEMIAFLSKELQKVEDCNRLVVAKLLQRELEVNECREQLWEISQNSTRANHLSSFLMNFFDPPCTTRFSGPLREQLLCEHAELKSTVEDQRKLMQQVQRDYIEYKEQATALKHKVAALMVELEVGGRMASRVEGFSQMMQSHIMSLLNGFEETRSQLFQELRSHLQCISGDRYQFPSEACATSIMNPTTDDHHCDDLHGSVLLNPPVPSSPPLDGFDYDEFEQDSMADETPPPPRHSSNRRGSSVDTTSETETERFHCPSNLSGAFHFDNEFTFRDDPQLASWKSPMCNGRSPEENLFRKLFLSSASIDSSRTNPLFSERRKSMQ